MQMVLQMVAPATKASITFDNELSCGVLLSAQIELRSDYKFTGFKGYCANLQEARTMGIPAVALPQVSRDASLEDIKTAQRRLSGMMASFLSSSL
jgi:hypothetical protein